MSAVGFYILLGQNFIITQNTHQWGWTNIDFAQATEPPAWGQTPSVINGVIVGSFEEQEEEIGVGCNVVKVESENLATPGSLMKKKAR